jgi:hypothetical protein
LEVVEITGLGIRQQYPARTRDTNKSLDASGGQKQ